VVAILNTLMLCFFSSFLLLLAGWIEITDMALILASTKNEEEGFRAILNGSEVSPPVSTNLSGIAQLVLEKSEPLNLNYNVTITGIDNNNNDNNITSVHLHNGIRGYNGTEIKELKILPGYNENGIVAKGNLSASDSFSSELAGKGDLALDSLIQYIGKGEVYLDVHTQDNPHGELRGQIFPSP
jgi:CHRD domain